jgi:hypothetical protein
MREVIQPVFEGDMTMKEISVQRLMSQRLLQPTFATPAEVVRWMGAVQAQDFLGSLWAIGCRMQDATEEVVEQAIVERTILRTWPMRGTVHFVPAEDARWMLDLMTPRVIARSQYYYRQAGLDEAIFARSRDLFIRALAGGKQLTRGNLYELLEAEGIATANSRGLFIIGNLSQTGLICFGARQGKQPTFTLLDEWVPNMRTLTREEALAEMALRYFRSHGPATIHDFVWWTGLLMTDARAELDAVKSHLIEDTIDGKTYWWAESVVSAPVSSPALHLLPAFDEYMVSYEDRSASLDPQHEKLLASENHLSSIIVIDGQVVGNWKRTFKKGAVVIETTPARTLTPAERDLFEAAAQRYGEFLGLPVVIA